MPRNRGIIDIVCLVKVVYMDIKRTKLNIGVSISLQIITTVVTIVVRRYLLQCCGNEVNGLNALYISIIGFLSVADLGIGTAITFSMYRPIVEGNQSQVAALYHYLGKAYHIVGTIILTVGLALMPWLKYFAKDYILVDANIYITFLIMLISVVITYFFANKKSLINAHKNDYLTTIITQGSLILQYILQIVVLYITKSFEAYLICRIVAGCIQWISTEIVARKKYRNIIKIKTKVDCETKRELKKNIKAMFMHKIGHALVNSVDSVVISAFVGVVSLGEFSNYSTILASMNGIVMLVFTSITSVVGHMMVQEDSSKTKRYFEVFHLLNFSIGIVFFLGYYAVIDSFIAMIFSPDLVVSKSISVVITINGFVQFMRRNALTFRDATGQFYGDRWKPLFEGICNIVLSIILVNILGVPGVIVATIITNLLICYVIEPYILYKNVFNVSPKQYYLKNYAFVGVFCVALAIMDIISVSFKQPIFNLLINGVLSIVVSLGISSIIFLINKNALFDMKELLKLDKR